MQTFFVRRKQDILWRTRLPLLFLARLRPQVTHGIAQVKHYDTEHVMLRAPLAKSGIKVVVALPDEQVAAAARRRPLLCVRLGAPQRGRIRPRRSYAFATTVNVTSPPWPTCTPRSLGSAWTGPSTPASSTPGATSSTTASWMRSSRRVHRGGQAREP